MAPAMGNGMPDNPDHEILIEMHRLGGAMEVRAVSAGDGLEVVFTCPSSASQHDIDQLARAKLAYVRSRGNTESGQGGDKSADSKPPDSKGGIIVWSRRRASGYRLFRTPLPRPIFLANSERRSV